MLYKYSGDANHISMYSLKCKPRVFMEVKKANVTFKLLKSEIKNCVKCGEITSRKICQACTMKRWLEEN